MSKPKDPGLLKAIREKLVSGGLRYSAHANQRMMERCIVRPEVEYVLKTGHHNKRKDKYNERHHDWDYAVEGKTVDGRNLRIIVAIISRDFLVVTAIDLDAGD